MTRPTTTRRRFLKTSASAAASTLALPTIFTGEGFAAETGKPEKLITAAIGVGGRGSGIGRQLRDRSRMVACCDVDQNHARRFKGKSDIEAYSDYRAVLDRKEIQAITVGTPDHWHTPIVLRAIWSGKDVYCEKPLTLTIAEGQLLVNAVKQTGRVLQVGTQQRTEMGRRFLQAVAIAHSGKLGRVKRVTACIGGAPDSGSFNPSAPPAHLDWDFWLGQAPLVPYTRERCHGNFRWWYEYSGGKMTDWGAHHVDIAQWILKKTDTGPTSVTPLSSTHPKAADKNGYNTATKFEVSCMFDDGGEIVIRHDRRNGCHIEAEKGNFYVGRGAIEGQIVDEIKKSKELTEWLNGEVHKLFAGRSPKGHMDNFLDAVADRKLPISDVYSHHRILTTCHLANIAIRTGRTIRWNPETELAIGDADINANWIRREQRAPYSFTA